MGRRTRTTRIEYAPGDSSTTALRPEVVQKQGQELKQTFNILLTQTRVQRWMLTESRMVRLTFDCSRPSVDKKWWDVGELSQRRILKSRRQFQRSQIHKPEVERERETIRQNQPTAEEVSLSSERVTLGTISWSSN